eukprot:m.35052 g.35052  ORF g.35052 m.35052 type:complete len:424 (-) comp12364_c0_seq1:144-1415(-)
MALLIAPAVNVIERVIELLHEAGHENVNLDCFSKDDINYIAGSSQNDIVPLLQRLMKFAKTEAQHHPKLPQTLQGFLQLEGQSYYQAKIHAVFSSSAAPLLIELMSPSEEHYTGPRAQDQFIFKMEDASADVFVRNTFEILNHLLAEHRDGPTSATLQDDVECVQYATQGLNRRVPSPTDSSSCDQIASDSTASGLAHLDLDEVAEADDVTVVQNHPWLQISTYRIFSLQWDETPIGLIEKTSGKPLADLTDENLQRSLADDSTFYQFIQTLAAGFAAAFMVGLRDRHHDNYLLSEEGTFCHIDLASFANDRTFLDTKSISISSRIINILNKRDENAWDYVALLSQACFDLFKSKADEFIEAVEGLHSEHSKRLTHYVNNVVKSSDDGAVLKAVVKANGIRTKIKNVFHDHVAKPISKLKQAF